MQDASADPPVSTRYIPAPQSMQDASVDPPPSSRYLPAPQSVHVTDPVNDLYLPATHAVHVPPSGPDRDPVHPAVQKQLVQLVKAALPTGELEFDGQFDGQVMHVVADVTLLYLPVPHAVHVELAEAPTGAEYVPAPHLVHRVASVAPISVEYVPAPQTMHESSEFCPVKIPYLPAPQSVHFMAADTVLYLPATHVVHSEFAEALPSSLVAVKSTPRTRASAMADVVSVLRYSSTTKTPAISPLKFRLPNLLVVEVLSVIFAEAVPEELFVEPRALFTVNQYSCVDARYLPTIVNHKPCSSTPYALTPPAMKNCELLSESCLDKYIIFPW